MLYQILVTNKIICVILGPSTSNALEPSIRMNAEVVKALSHIVVAVGSEKDMKRVLIQGLESTGTVWSASLDRRQVENNVIKKKLIFWYYK